MRVLRTTIHLPGQEPMHMIVRDSDVTDTLESIHERWLDAPADAPPEVLEHGRPFIAQDIFEMQDASIVEASAKAMERIDEEREHNQAILYYWIVRQVLPMLSEHGAYIVPDPSPLNHLEIEAVLWQVVRHAAYKHQRISVPDEHGQRTEVHEGKVRR